MSAPRFYYPADLSIATHLELTDTLFRHVVQVLRLRAGDELVLFNGSGGEYHGILEQVQRRSASMYVQEFKNTERESALPITLLQGISKGDRMDYALQKATELGVAAIQPVQTERSVVSLDQQRWQKRIQHWQGVVIAACEQSGRNQVPKVAESLTLQQWLGQCDSYAQILLLEPGAGQSLAGLNKPQLPLALMIGPEGGFSDAELQATQQAGAVTASLGPRILRTETATVTALSVMQALWGDFA